jgi:hypothetical protein
LFILIDETVEGFIPFYDYINEWDDKPLIALADLDDISDYTPNGSFHVVDTFDELKDYIGVVSEIPRWNQLVLAAKGARVFSNDFDEDSPIYAGTVPSLERVRRVAVDAANAETRAGHMAQYGVNYIGRTKLSPRNVFVLDNKKGNPLHDPSLDPTLEALYASLPDDWWGSCAFVSSGNVDRLEAFLRSDDMFSVIPLGYTPGAAAKLKYMGLEYVDAGTPTAHKRYGIEIRDKANRLSYKLSLEGYPEEELEAPKDTSWLQL